MSRRHTRPAPQLLQDLGEWSWLARLGRSLNQSGRAVVVGFGDDAACLSLPSRPGSLTLLTTDILVEGTHFTWHTATPATLGEKAVAVNVSDIAAKGGRPTAMVLGLGAPANFELARLETLYRAIRRACRRWGIALVGGDTVRSEKLILAPTLLGEFDGPIEKLPLRNRLRESQHLNVTGSLGDSAAGLELLLSRQGTVKHHLTAACRDRLIERHQRPKPRVDEGRLLAHHLTDLAMMDLSDDLQTSVRLLSEASRVGVTIHLDELPLSAAVRVFCRAARRDPIEMAAGGGEDYELLFATSVGPDGVQRILRDGGLRTKATAIGRAEGRRVRWLDHGGKEVPGRWKPFEHFAVRSSEF